MERFILILSLIFGSCATMANAAPEQDNQVNPTDPNIHNPGGRPKAPSIKWGKVTYESGLLYINLARPEGNCLVTITTGDMESESFSFNSEAPMPIFIGEVSYISIIIETELGNIYHTEI